MSDEKIEDLERRLLLVENALENSEGVKRVELAEATFKTVLDADYHLDDKASRILSAMAFFTAAAAAIFAKAYSSTMPQYELRSRIAKALAPFTIQGAPSSTTVVDSVISNIAAPSAQLFGHDLSLIAFLGYMLFVIISAGFYLAALGPSLNKPSGWLASTKTIRSRLFYDFIAQVNENDWSEHWTSATAPIASLHQEFQDNYVFESRLLAEKARAKYLWLSFGSLFLRLALLCLIVLTVSLFASRTQTVGVLSTLGCALLFVVFVFQNITKTSKPKIQDLLGLWTACLMSATLLLVSFSVLLGVDAKLNLFAAAAVFSGGLVTLLRSLDQIIQRPVRKVPTVSWIILAMALVVAGILILIY
jgi:hypothetical protein